MRAWPQSDLAPLKRDRSVAFLVGRERELERLLAIVDGIQDRGGALVVRGEPGIGKSALLEAAAALARAQGISVLMTTAVESESRLPFAGLPELLLPFLDRLDRLPEVQRHALEKRPSSGSLLTAVESVAEATAARGSAEYRYGGSSF